MNCFNIRELQGMLKRKYFTDLMNTLDHRTLINQSMINLRYKSNSNNNLDLDFLNFQNFGLHLSDSIKSVNLSHSTGEKEGNHVIFLDSNDFYFLHSCLCSKDFLKELINYFQKGESKLSMFGLVQEFTSLFSTLEALTTHSFKNSVSIISLTRIFNVTAFLDFPSISTFFKCLSNNFLFFDTNLHCFYYLNFKGNKSYPKITKDVPFTTHNTRNTFDLGYTTQINTDFTELTNSYRFNRFVNALVEYDYKVGNYLGD
jgi:hypothetical protein